MEGKVGAFGIWGVFWGCFSSQIEFWRVREEGGRVDRGQLGREEEWRERRTRKRWEDNMVGEEVIRCVQGDKPKRSGRTGGKELRRGGELWQGRELEG